MTIAVQILAFALGAVFSLATIPESEVWVDNAFVFALTELWPVGPFLLVTVLATVVLIQRHNRSPSGDQSHVGSNVG